MILLETESGESRVFVVVVVLLLRICELIVVR